MAPMEQSPEQAMKALRPSKTPWFLFLLALAACGGLGYAAWRLLEQANAAQAGRDEAVQRLATAEKARGELEQKVTAVEKEKGELASKTEKLQANLEQT